MNDQDLLQQLDDRAARAASDLHARAGARPRPAFDPGRSLGSVSGPPRSIAGGGPRRALAVAAVVLLVAGIGVGGWAATRPDPDRGPATTTGGPVRPRVATDLPDGLALAGAFHRGETEADDGTTGETAVPSAFYGPGATDPQLVVALASGFAEDDEGLGPRIELGDGRTGRTLGALFGVPGLLVSGGGDPILLLSRSLSTTELGDLAASVSTAAGGPEVATSALPDGWRLLTREPDLLTAINPVAATGTAGEQHGVVYTGATETGGGGEVDRVVAVLTLPGDESRLAVDRLLQRDVEEVDVQGLPALVGRGPVQEGAADGELWTVAWLAEPGTLVRISSYGIGRDELLQVADGLVVATDDDWAELERRTQLGDVGGQVGSGQGEEIGRGTFSAGGDWVLRLISEGPESAPIADLRVAIGDPGGQSGSSADPGAAAFRAIQTLDVGDRHFASGLLADGVATVELRGADGTVLGRAEVVEGAGVRAWVAELTTDPVVVVALDGDGNEVDRREIEGGDVNETPGDGIDGPGSPTTFEGQGTPIDPGAGGD